MPRQRNHVKALWQHLLCEFIRIALLRHQKLVPQLPWGISAVEEGRLQQRVPREVAVDPRGIDSASGLSLQVSVSADMVGVGVGVVDGGELPSVFVQNLPHLASGFLVISAVDEADFRVAELYKPDLGRTLDVVAMLRHLYQFIHCHHFFSVRLFFFQQKRPAGEAGLLCYICSSISARSP